MPSRTFTDDRGRKWVVLAVSPTQPDRRVGKKDRRVRDIGPPPGQPERRKGSDRRSRLPDGVPRTKVDPSLAGGWLVFERAGERRKVSPTPPDWHEASDEQLRQLLAQATVIFNPRGRLIE